MVFQSGALFDSLTVGENVGFLLYEHSDLPRDTVKVRACTLEPAGRRARAHCLGIRCDRFE